MHQPNSFRLLRALGIRGAIKSINATLRFSSLSAPLIFTKNSKIDIHSDANILVEDSFIFGVNFNGPPGYQLGPSLISLDQGSSLKVNGSAWIGQQSWVNIKGSFQIGDSYVSSRTRIDCEEEITIGDGCAIAWDVDLLDTDFHRLKVGGKKQPTTAPINIHDNVWIGKGASISKGVTIHEGAVVASDSVVTKDVPNRCLVAGVPAEVKAKDVSWE